MLNNLCKAAEFARAYFNYKSIISTLTDCSIKDVNKLYQEILYSDFMKQITEKAINIVGKFPYLSMLSPIRAPTLYVLCRIFKPVIVVETGVAEGISSAFFLKALEANKKGNLYSIDLPNFTAQELKDGKSTGWLVPENLKNRWTLIIGSSKEILPLLLSELKEVNIFYHDSDHSYENTMFEFKTVLVYLEKNGLILSDDITDNNAFRAFCDSKQYRFLKLFKLGIIKV